LRDKSMSEAPEGPARVAVPAALGAGAFWARLEWRAATEGDERPARGSPPRSRLESDNVTSRACGR
jgi:hypothetical protein